MQLTETIRLYPNKEQEILLKQAMAEYIQTVNSLVSDAAINNKMPKLTSKDIQASLPSAIKNQCIRDAKSVWDKKKKHGTIPVLRKPVYYVNNQNFKITGSDIQFPTWQNNKSTRIAIQIKLTDKQQTLLSGNKLGLLRIVRKNKKLMAQVSYHVPDPAFQTAGNVMGIDLGIKCPAVSYCSDGSVKFYGNGRQNKYIRRHYAYLRKKLQKNKKTKAIKRINNKEQRIMKDIDHKISREIVNTAKSHNVSLIKLESLSGIRSTTRKSRKNNKSLHVWSFYRLLQYITYKANQAGIRVEQVNPAYTSQTCPWCNKRHHASDRKYRCQCGFHAHRDLVGAINICRSTEYAGG